MVARERPPEMGGATEIAMPGLEPVPGERPSNDRGDVVGAGGETRREREQKDLGLLAAAGSGAGCLILALPILGFGALVWLVWRFVIGG